MYAVFEEESFVFAYALLSEAKRYGLNTAVETTGCLPYHMIERMLPLLDTVLMDIKHVNSLKHEEFTGLRNELILSNARRIAESGVRLVIRVPTVPGFNDTEEEIASIARFAASLSSRLTAISRVSVFRWSCCSV